MPGKEKIIGAGGLQGGENFQSKAKEQLCLTVGFSLESISLHTFNRVSVFSLMESVCLKVLAIPMNVFTDTVLSPSWLGWC